MPTLTDFRVTHLRQLEAESIYILREVAADFARPVLLYSIGKDSSVMLHLARKAFRRVRPLNTSFNDCGEPLVCSPQDAARISLKMDLDAVVIVLFRVQKRPQACG